MTQLVCQFCYYGYQDDMDMVQSDEDEKRDRGTEEDKRNSSPKNQVSICC